MNTTSIPVTPAAAAEFGRRLKAARLQRGEKQAVTAMKVGVDVVTFSRWERGIHLPRADHVPRLCAVLRISESELGPSEPPVVASAVSLVRTPMATGTAEDEADVRRREFLQGALAFGGALAFAPLDWDHLAAALTRPTAVNAQLLSDMHGVTREHMRLCHLVAPSALLPSVESHLIVLRRLHGESGGDVLADARMATAQSAMVAAWLLMEAGDRPNARSRFGLAEELAADHRQGSTRAQVLAASSYLDTGVAGGHRSWRALSLLDEAEACAPSDSSFVRAYIHARRAEERAAAGDATGAEDDLERAQQCLACAQFDPDAIYAYRDGELWLDAYRASVYRLLGRSADAAAAATRAIPSLRPHHQPPALCDQAGAAVLAGDMDVACAMLVDATGIATASGNLTYLDRVRGIRAQFDQHSSGGAVRRLDDALAAVTA
jgi:transcriptional regulator with XRE-family HTH domain